MISPLDIQAQKAAMRRQAMAQRTGLDDDGVAHALAARVTNDIPMSPGTVVAGVWPKHGELDLRPLLHALHAGGCLICLPETLPRGNPLIFRRWVPGATMIPERFGTFRPDGAIVVPDIILVPLLAFDRAGHRLGYGGGYYDRTLAALPGSRAIGFAYAAQQVASVPVEPHDQPLPLIVTEHGLIHPSAT